MRVVRKGLGFGVGVCEVGSHFKSIEDILIKIKG